MESVVSVILLVLAAYLAIGGCLLVPFHRRALPRLDESADGASVGFRILVSPGLIALWPVVLQKWMKSRRGEDPHGTPDAPIPPIRIRRAQSLLIKLLAIALPIFIAASILTRAEPPQAVDPALLTAPSDR